MGTVSPINRQPEPELMTPGEVASLFRVDPKNVVLWANQGKLSSIRTIGGHRRYFRAEVLALLEASRQERTS